MPTPSIEEIAVINDFEQIAAAWMASKQGDYTFESVRLTAFVLESIARGNAIAVEDFAEFSDLSTKEAKVHFRRMRMSGADFDDEGRLIGNALTLRPTRNVMTINGRQLYAWCALDTLFLPGLVGETAAVHSISPASGDRVQLTVRPTGVESFSPTDAVLSVVVPGVSRACEPGRPGGAEGDVCSAMHFFSNRAEAAGYLGDDSDVAVLSVEQASELAQRVWVRPFRSVLEPDADIGSGR